MKSAVNGYTTLATNGTKGVRRRKGAAATIGADAETTNTATTTAVATSVATLATCKRGGARRVGCALCGARF
jgi:hypothetical protein